MAELEVDKEAVPDRKKWGRNVMKRKTKLYWKTDYKPIIISIMLITQCDTRTDCTHHYFVDHIYILFYTHFFILNYWYWYELVYNGVVFIFRFCFV